MSGEQDVSNNQQSSDEQGTDQQGTDFYRIITLVIDIGTYTLQRTFNHLIPNQDVKSYFKNEDSKLKSMLQEKILTKVQYDKVMSSNPKPEEFDISLLVKLLTNIFPVNIVPPPIEGWHKDPQKTDICLGANLIRIRNIRNEIVGHKTKALLSETEFEGLWTQVRQILKRIAKCISIDEKKIVKDKIKKLKKKVLDVSDREKRLLEAFLDWCKDDTQKFQEQLTNVEKSLESLHLKVDVIQRSADITDAKCLNMDNSQNEIWKDIINQLKYNFTSIATQESLERVNQRVVSNSCMADRLLETLQELKQMMTTFNQSVASLAATSQQQHVKTNLQAIYGHPPSVMNSIRLLPPNDVAQETRSALAVYDSDIDKWSKMIGKDWNQLRIYLNLTVEQEDHVKDLYPRDMKKRIYTMLRKWHDVVVSCGENPKLLLAAAFVQADTNYQKAYKIVAAEELDEKLESSAHTQELIREIDFGSSQGENQDAVDTQSIGTYMTSQGCELKKVYDDTFCQSAMDNLTIAMQSIGAVLYGHDVAGTAFRVGKKYVMTAAHVVEQIHEDRIKKIHEDWNCFINFNESPIQQSPNIFMLKEPECYLNKELDIAVLEIVNPAESLPKPLLLSNINSPQMNFQKTALIGFGHPNDIKKHLEHCSIIHKDDQIILSAHKYVSKERNKYRNLLKLNGIYPDLVDSAYNGCQNDTKFILNCYMEQGASGAPLLSSSSSEFRVVGVLTHGLPEFYFCLQQAHKVTFPESYRFEVASRMKYIFQDMCNVNQQLAVDCFGQCYDLYK